MHGQPCRPEGRAADFHPKPRGSHDSKSPSGICRRKLDREYAFLLVPLPARRRVSQRFGRQRWNRLVVAGHCDHLWLLMDVQDHSALRDVTGECSPGLSQMTDELLIAVSNFEPGFGVVSILIR